MATTAYSVLILALGVSVGSFLNVIADSLPSGRPLLNPGSSCDSCMAPLRAVDKMPVLSYIWLRGRCRHCGILRIPGRLPIAEAATGGFYVLFYWRHGFEAEFFIFIAATSLLVVVTLIDLTHRLILNKIVFPSILALLALSPFWGQLGDGRHFFGMAGMFGSFANSLTAGIGYLLLILATLLINPKGMGMGDVKLAGLLGLLVGSPLVFVAFSVTVVVGSGAAAYLLLAKGMGRHDVIPYGPFMVLGAIIALLVGADIWGWYSDFALSFGSSS